MGRTIQDWVLAARSTKGVALSKWADSIETTKREDLERLKTSGLSQSPLITMPFQDFKYENPQVAEFYEKSLADKRTFCARAMPNAEGLKRGLKRQPKRGLVSFRECLDFLQGFIGKNSDFYDAGISSHFVNLYGGVIISGAMGGRLVYGEISKNLDKLTSGEEEPIAGFTFDRAKLGHVENKVIWHIERGKRAKAFLWKTFCRYILLGEDRFNPIIWSGYFEFVLSRKGEAEFLDYKFREAYLG